MTPIGAVALACLSAALSGWESPPGAAGPLSDPAAANQRLTPSIAAPTAEVPRNARQGHKDFDPVWNKLYSEAESLYRKRKYAEALPVAQEALRVAEASFGPEDRAVSLSLYDLAAIYQAQAKYAEAEPLFKRSLAIAEKTMGLSGIVTVLNALAMAYALQGKVSEAEPLYKRSLAIAEKTLGPDHPLLALTLVNYAELLRRTERVAEAEQMTARAKQIRARQLARARAHEKPIVGLLGLGDSGDYAKRLDSQIKVYRLEVAIESRWARREANLVPLARELVSRRASVIVAVGTDAVEAARKVTTSIPIVMIDVNDPVGRGYVASLKRPGGNITGCADASGVRLRRQLDLIREVLPQASRFAILFDPGDPVHTWQLKQIEPIAQAARLTLIPIEVQSPEGIDRAFAAIVEQRLEAVVVLDTRRRSIAEGIEERALRHRLPAVFGWWEAPRLGGRLLRELGDALFGWWKALRPKGRGPIAVVADWDDQNMIAAGNYAVSILKGAEPSELPVEEPSTRILINLRTARAIGITIPAAVLRKANMVIGPFQETKTIMELLLSLVNPLSWPALGYVVYQIWLTVRLRLWWKICAAPPVPFMAYVFYQAFQALEERSNLWWLGLTFSSLPALVFLGILHVVARRLGIMKPRSLMRPVRA